MPSISMEGMERAQVIMAGQATDTFAGFLHRVHREDSTPIPTRRPLYDDDQQRLTTFQIFLSAFRDVCAAEGQQAYAEECDDARFRQAWLNNPVYSSMGASRVQYALREMERRLHQPRAERITSAPTLELGPTSVRRIAGCTSGLPCSLRSRSRYSATLVVNGSSRCQFPAPPSTTPNAT